MIQGMNGQGRLRPLALYRAALVSLLLVASLCLPGAALSSTPPQPEPSEAEYDAAFAAYYADPTDTAAAARFARLAIRRGEFETAAGTLERVLMVAPDLAVVRAELGILYYRLGSYRMARHHLRKAVESGRLDSDKQERSQEILKLSESKVSRHDFSGFARLGVRYQTNASFGNDRDFVFANGGLVPASDDFDDEDDFNVFALVSFDYGYDLATQNDAKLEVDGIFYGSKQFQVDENDAVFGQLRVGPSFQPDPAGARGLRLKPYGLARGNFVQDDVYSGAFGGGLRAEYDLAEDWRLLIDGNGVATVYNDTGDRPRASDQEGLQFNGWASIRYTPSDSSYIVLKGRGFLQDADESWNDYYELSVMLTGGFFYEAPGQITEGPWHLRLFGGFEYREHEDGDPQVNAAKAREDHLWTVGAAHSVWLTSYDAINAEVAGTFVDSNIRNYDRENISGILSYTRRF